MLSMSRPSRTGGKFLVDGVDLFQGGVRPDDLVKARLAVQVEFADGAGPAAQGEVGIIGIAGSRS